MGIKITTLFFVIGIHFFIEQPEKLTWEILSKVTYKEIYLEDQGLYFDYPTFSEEIKKLEGSEIFISGYIIPIDVAANYYVLSAFPYASCFFCGGAGPETVMDIQLKDQKVRFNNDERVTLKGTFKLNDSDVFQLNYLLIDAEIYKP